MTKLEYLDLLVATSASGGFPSAHVVPEDTEAFFKTQVACDYRSPNGRRCAAGLLIPDEKYDPVMENKPAYSEVVLAAIELPDGITATELRIIQTRHDTHADACLKAGKPWPHAQFVASLLALDCFHNMTPTTTPAETTP